MVDHADSLLRPGCSEAARGDAIAALRRAVGQRVRVFSDVHRLEHLPLERKPKNTMELLEVLGVIRPIMLRTLVDIRNAYEHEDIPPPSEDRCRELADLAWYFLRSTEWPVKVIPTSFIIWWDDERTIA